MKYCQTCNAECHVKDETCGKCGAPFGAAQRAHEYAEARALMEHVPILSLQHAVHWDYTTLSLVTAQTVTGTGVFADVGSVVTDMFGRQSGMFINKLRHGEALCKAELRLQALRLRAHAIIGVDVDYAEVGGVRSMLMVCMTGTAVRLRDLSVLEPEAAAAIGRANEILRGMDAA